MIQPLLTCLFRLRPRVQIRRQLAESAELLAVFRGLIAKRCISSCKYSQWRHSFCTLGGSDLDLLKGASSAVEVRYVRPTEEHIRKDSLSLLRRNPRQPGGSIG